MRASGVEPESLAVLLTLPTNEAVCAAVAGGAGLTAVSELVARPHIEAGRLCLIDHALPKRRFALVHHRERFRTKAALAFEDLMRGAAREMARRQDPVSFDI